jgi:hypothetical protein
MALVLRAVMAWNKSLERARSRAREGHHQS